MASVLIVDDNETMRDGMAVVMKQLGHEVAAVSRGEDAVTAYKKERYDFVITDLKMAPVDGIDVVRRIRAHDPEATLMVVTAYGTIESAVEALKEGAIDYIEKPFSPEVLRAKAQKGLEVAGLRRAASLGQARSAALLSDAARAFDVKNLVGQSEPMRRVTEAVRKVAATQATVHIYGESGTGKELVARAIHEHSPRKDGPFVTVSCAALTETLLESELFGHEKGAFTGAVKRKIGRFELADQGTLFLDEIGEISPSIQVKLLRVLQERSFERVGGEQTLKVDVRIVSATNRDLKAQVEKGAFREDLYYRLHIVPITLPPLRERPDDIALLAEHFLAKAGPRMGKRLKGLTPEAKALLGRHRWPGNVRELENAIEQAVVFAEGDELRAQDLPAFLLGSPPGATLPVPSGDRSLTEILEGLEKDLILAAFEKAKGVKAEAARLLGIKASALYYKLEKYGIAQAGEGGSAEG